MSAGPSNAACMPRDFLSTHLGNVEINTAFLGICCNSGCYPMGGLHSKVDMWFTMFLTERRRPILSLTGQPSRTRLWCRRARMPRS